MGKMTENTTEPIISTSYRLQSAAVAILCVGLMIYLSIYFKASPQLQTMIFLLFIGTSMFFVHKTASLVKAIDRSNADIITRLNKKYAKKMAENPDDLFMALQSFSPEDREILFKNLEASGQSRTLFIFHVIMHIVGIATVAYIILK